MRFRLVFGCVLAWCLVSCSETPGPLETAPATQPVITEDVVYGHKDGLAMVFNVYQPAEPNGLGIVFINSGGWKSPFWQFLSDDDGGGRRLLSRAEIEGMNPRHGVASPQPLLDQGYTVFDVRHGSSPRFTLPEIVSDLRRAVRFVWLHASDYNIDPERLGLWGASAGGNLSLILGTTSEVGVDESEDPMGSVSGRVSAVVCYYGASDLTRWVTPERLDRFAAMRFDRDRYPDYSPIRFASADDPPILILHGDQDDLVPIEEGRTMHEALIAAGARSKFVVIEGAGHPFIGAEVDRAATEMVDWFERHLRDQ
jgi:predicted esterase